jgi:predicted aspartyl protease
MVRGLGVFPLLVIAVASLLDAASEVATTEFWLSPYGGVVVPVNVNGARLRFLVDTGSSHSAISARAATALRAPVIARAPLTSSGGVQWLPVVGLELAVGPVVATVQASVVTAMPVPGEADGVVGQDVLGSRHFTIDYRQRRLEWHLTSDEPTPTSALPLTELHGRFVVAATIAGRETPLVLDTAADRLVLFSTPLDREPKRPVPLSSVLGSLTGPATVRTTEVNDLALGRWAFPRVKAAVVDRPWQPGEPEGLLPTHGFSRVTINGPARTLIVEATDRPDVFLMTDADR